MPLEMVTKENNGPFHSNWKELKHLGSKKGSESVDWPLTGSKSFYVTNILFTDCGGLYIVDRYVYRNCSAD